MNENKQSLKTYLSDYKKSHEGKKKDGRAKAPVAPAVRIKSAAKRKKSPVNTPHDGLTNVSPPPELGENLNA